MRVYSDRWNTFIRAAAECDVATALLPGASEDDAAVCIRVLGDKVVLQVAEHAVLLGPRQVSQTIELLGREIADRTSAQLRARAGSAPPGAACFSADSEAEKQHTGGESSSGLLHGSLRSLDEPYASQPVAGQATQRAAAILPESIEWQSALYQVLLVVFGMPTVTPTRQERHGAAAADSRRGTLALAAAANEASGAQQVALASDGHAVGRASALASVTCFKVASCPAAWDACVHALNTWLAARALTLPEATGTELVDLYRTLAPWVPPHELVPVLWKVTQEARATQMQRA